ncbi:MAG: hypothetical protein IT583_00955 [Verrucomicrobia bacterium]|nr:hypothetical protein [Verrucomicrobiota bacterium]
MTMKKSLFVIAGVLLAVSAQAASYFESFETRPVGSIKGMSGWSTIGNSNYVNIVSNPAIATDGKQYLVWTNIGVANATDPNAVTRLYRSSIQKAVSNQPVMVAWDFNMVERNPSAYTYCDVIHGNGVGATVTRFYFNSTATFAYYTAGGVSVDTLVTFKTNNWYRIQVTANLNNTFDLKVIDLVTASNVVSVLGRTNYVGAAAITNVYALQWNVGNSTPARPSLMYLDNLIVTEPNTRSVNLVIFK